MTWARVIGALSAVSIALTPSASHDSQAANAASALRFRGEEIAADFGIGYAVTTGDVNGDGRTDVEHRCLRPRHAGRQDLLTTPARSR